MQKFEVIVAGGIIIPLLIVQEVPLTAKQVYDLLISRVAAGLLIVSDEAVIDARTFMGVRKVTQHEQRH